MFKDSATGYLKKGLSLFPAGPNKKPLVKEWTPYQKRQPTAEEIDVWSKEFPLANIALVCGHISNLTVVDADTKEAVTRIENLIPDQTVLPIVNTPRGGRHYYFRFCPELYSRNGAQEKIDVKSTGGYVLAPPSSTENGKYCWVNGYGLETTLDRPTLPQSLFDFLKVNFTNGTGAGLPVPGAPLLAEGNRDDYLFHAALQLFKDGRNFQEVEKIILNMARVCNPPFPDREALRKVQSAFQRSKRATADEEPRFIFHKASEIGLQPIRWLWGDVIPTGMVTALVGNPGVAKTFIGADLAARVTTGRGFRPYKNTAPPIQGSVIYITSEGVPEMILNPRLEAAGADRDKIEIYEGIYSQETGFCVLDVSKHLPFIEKKMLKNPVYALVVIDPIASHLSPKINMLDTVQMRTAMDAVSRFAQNTGVAVVVIMHFNKDTTKQVIHRTSGSVQLMAAVKSAWAVIERPKDDENRRYLCPVKSNLATCKKSLPFLLEDTTIKATAGESINTAKVNWDSEPVALDIEEIISPRASEGQSMTTEATQFLKEQLKDGPKRARALYESAERAGIKSGILWRAKERLGILDDKQGFQGPSFWFLPDSSEDAPEGVR